MPSPNLPAWLTGILAPASAVLGAVAKGLLDRWRHRPKDQADLHAANANAADTLVGTAMRLIEQLQLELESLRERLAFCQKERDLQEDVIGRLRDLVDTLAEERDAMRTLLDCPEGGRP